MDTGKLWGARRRHRAGSEIRADVDGQDPKLGVSLIRMDSRAGWRVRKEASVSLCSVEVQRLTEALSVQQRRWGKVAHWCCALHR
jgi:hypothetical protein